MKVLIACEESQTVCKAFRARGHEAYSCDIVPCSGGHPEWHIQDDVLNHLNDGWDMMIAHPPCTDLCVAGSRWFPSKIKNGEQQKSIEFFMKFTNVNIPKIVIENPVGIMSKLYRTPDQIINPYEFGETACKKTCLWLKGVPPLKPTDICPEELRTQEIWTGKFDGVQYAWNSDECKRLRSKTFPGIAEAMADQWGNIEDYPSFTQQSIFDINTPGRGKEER